MQEKEESASLLQSFAFLNSLSRVYCRERARALERRQNITFRQYEFAQYICGHSSQRARAYLESTAHRQRIHLVIIASENKKARLCDASASTMDSSSQATEQAAQQNTVPLMCRANCGFYGSPQYDNYCSKCFKDTIRRKQDTQQSAASAAPPTAMATTSTQMGVGETAVATSVAVSVAAPAQPHDSVETKAELASSQEASAPPATTSTPIDVKRDSPASPAASTPNTTAPASPNTAPVKKNRCATCKRKVGLTGFSCRCGGLYCSEHRYSDAHSCTFDYKTHGKEQLRKQNPGCVAAKIDKL